MADIPTRESPYVGLFPYSEADAPFFFGRNREVEIVIANLRASPLTLLYGPSGVGKSSLLHAGVLYRMVKQARQNRKLKGSPEFAVALFDNWAGEWIAGLSDSVHTAILTAQKVRALERVPAPDLVTMIEKTVERSGLELLIILDQFEEFFLYRGETSSSSRFASQFTQIVNRRDLPVRFLISFREDMMSRLDFFKGRIPNLFDNRLMIAHMKTESAREAITGPIQAYNELYKPERPFEIEPQLIEEVLKQVKPKQIALEGTGQGVAPDAEIDSYIDTHYLQLVMTRLWDEETRAGSNILRAGTLANLGGATKIIRTHLDSVMDMLSGKERRVAADCFKYLVTPTGTKIALTAATLAEWTSRPAEVITPVLEKLVTVGNKKGGDEQAVASDSDKRSPGQSRILRPVEIRVSESKEPEPGYEVWHDALTTAIMDWRSRYLVRAERNRAWVIGLIILLGVMTAGVWYAMGRSEKLAEKLRQETEQKESALKAESVAEELQKDTQAALDSARVSESLNSILLGISSPVKEEREASLTRLKEISAEGNISHETKKKILNLVSEMASKEAEEAKRTIERQPVQGDNPPNYDRLRARVYMHIQDERQAEGAKEVEKQLKQAGFLVPPIQNVGRRKISVSEVRYFRNNESQLGNQVVEVLRRAGVNASLRYLSGFEDSTAMRPKHFEVWFAVDALSAASAR
jgi:hypothetical protein